MQMFIGISHITEDAISMTHQQQCSTGTSGIQNHC